MPLLKTTKFIDLTFRNSVMMTYKYSVCWFLIKKFPMNLVYPVINKKWVQI